jgi:hypothetical protein
MTNKQNETAVIVGADTSMYELSSSAAPCKGTGRLIVSIYLWQTKHVLLRQE